MSKKKEAFISTFVQATKAAAKNPAGTARLVAGTTVLLRAKDQGLTFDQMRGVFDDLTDYGDSELTGFLNISQGLISGDIELPGSIK
ncbi:hypothetical protein C5Y41_04110 [Rahnella variigena]|uniref:hypothetical protein n=1 Tax=Rahnella TaxID=34037 RepID=UPI00101C3E83|nr:MULTISPECIES: hypothetical protein [Rahnella]RYJ16475.1 hypothetical protein C5Y41_04110 [Rahnella variigena]TCQ89212.1 hypothetical protein EC840_104118 [Rahnella sp. JUb53]